MNVQRVTFNSPIAGKVRRFFPSEKAAGQFRHSLVAGAEAAYGKVPRKEIVTEDLPVELSKEGVLKALNENG